MELAEQLEKLQALRTQGALTEEEFTQAKKRLLEGAPAAPGGDGTSERGPSALQQLRRSVQDRWIGGVCGGLGLLTNIPSWAWRILFVLTALLHGLGVVMYLLLWIFVPLNLPAARAGEPKF